MDAVHLCHFIYCKSGQFTNHFVHFSFAFQKYKEFERAVRVEEMDGLRFVKRLAKDMEEMFHEKAQAMKVGYGSMQQYKHDWHSTTTYSYNTRSILKLPSHCPLIKMKS